MYAAPPIGNNLPRLSQGTLFQIKVSLHSTFESVTILYIRWGNSYSDFFISMNGVKQGGILSPLFFNVYMDNLSAQLNSQHISCNFSNGDVVVNHMLYADDIALF